MRLLLKCATIAAAVAARPTNAEETPKPQVPGWNTDTMPIAIHAANMSGAYTQDALEQLAKYDMVTFEKWYTQCGSQSPIQAGPECDVEGKTYEAFNTIAALNPNTLLMLYVRA